MFIFPRNQGLRLRREAAGLAAALGFAVLSISAQQPVSQDSLEQRAVQVLEERCQTCHNNSIKLGELALDSFAGLQRGGVHGPSVVAGDPQKSRLYRRAARLEEPFMPMQGEPLADSEVDVIRRWIESGANWPGSPGDSGSLSGEAAVASTDAASNPEGRFFQEQIHPILVRCQSCHDNALKYSGLSLETPEALSYGGLKGRVVVPGDPEFSSLYRKAARLDPHFMPLSAVMLSEEEIENLRVWIRDGAIWPDPQGEARASEHALRMARLKPFEEKEFSSEDRQWWAFQPPVRHAVPVVGNPSRISNEIDAFIVAAQQSKGIEPAPPADREVLLRRVYFDLTGLPPTPEERDRFLNDELPDAYKRLVEKLLASPSYGERWSRYWLDVARYADSDGYEYDKLRPNAWRYRDYVIRAFNDDKPYDRFIREQLAGDELADRDYDSITALGFCRNGPFIGDMAFMQNEETRQDELDDIVSTTGAAFLGLTVGCARCHNHKYDPIAQKDYYRMVAIFASSIRKDVPLASAELTAKYYRDTGEIDRQVEDLKYRIYKVQEPTRNILLEAKYKKLPEPLQVAIHTPLEQRSEAQKRLAREVRTSVGVSKDEILKSLEERARDQLQELEEQVKQLEESRPSLPMAQAITDMSPEARPSYFLHRGSVRSKGSAVEPGTLAVLHRPGEDIEFTKPDSNAKTTGRRLALANWIASAENPLTARVMVNRIWQHHFGRGIVSTSSNFGLMGELPTHPELLDWLATEFVQRGWSVKSIHRLILMSQTYRQASTFESTANRQLDPDNRLLWRMPLRRLEGEIIRDSILAISGGLNRQSGGPPVFPAVDEGIIESSPKGGDYQRWPGTLDGPAVWKRSIYVAQMRTITPPILNLFDPPDTAASCARRDVTTVPTQALQLMNNEFVVRQAALFADRVRNEAGPDAGAQVRRAFLLSLSRSPKARELDESLRYLHTQQEYHAANNQQLREQGVDPSKIPTPEMGSLIDLCHGLFNINEFVYVN